MNKLLFICISSVLCFIVAQDLPLLINFNRHCVRCLCHAATGCDFTIGCVKGYCGPFKISRIYWIDAGNLTLAGDDPERAGAYEDCSLSYNCAQRIVANYLEKYGRDCNEDGVTNCDDYNMIHFNGGHQCQPPLDRNEADIPLPINFNQYCVRCLCRAATGCDLTIGCAKGYCGPFRISRIYWLDAGNVTLEGDDPERAGAYEDCCLTYDCAQKIVANYLIKYGRDCNEDGVTNCDDYNMIHFNGGHQCQPPLDRNEVGRDTLRRYRMCNPIRNNE